jgi:hypothetical protein
MDFTYGVEIECFLPVGRTREELATAISAAVPIITEVYNHHSSRESWKIVTDASLGDYTRGAEVVSPVLRGEDGLRDVMAVCALIKGFGCTVDQRCGLHVHVGVPEGRRPNTWGDDQVAQVAFMKNVFMLYTRHEKTIDSLVPSSRRNSRWCQSPAPRVGRVKTAANINTLGRVFPTDSHRYYKLNLRSYWRHGTVEFRQHSGTIEGHKAVNWVRFCLAMCAKATEHEVETTVVPGAPVLHLLRRDDRLISILGAHPATLCRGRLNRARFAELLNNMTIGAALAVGLRRDDIREATRRGWIAIVNTTTTGGEPTVTVTPSDSVTEMAAELELPAELTTYLVERANQFAEAA